MATGRDGGGGEPIDESLAALVTAHALGALDPAEADAAERLIASSPELRRVFEEALETAAALALATSQVEPPPGLRQRILDAVRDLDPPAAT